MWNLIFKCTQFCEETAFKLYQMHMFRGERQHDGRKYEPSDERSLVTDIICAEYLTEKIARYFRILSRSFNNRCHQQGNKLVHSPIEIILFQLGSKLKNEFSTWIQIFQLAFQKFNLVFSTFWKTKSRH